MDTNILCQLSIIWAGILGFPHLQGICILFYMTKGFVYDRLDTLITIHHIVTTFIVVYVYMYEHTILLPMWSKLAMVMESSSLEVLLYQEYSKKSYYDKLILLGVYLPCRFWYVPSYLNFLWYNNGLFTPIAFTWCMVAVSGWWIRNIILNVIKKTIY